MFSVLVTVNNQTQYLGKALDTLLDQTDPDWEAVVVNDGSTDSTPEVLKTYCSKDSRFRVIHKENGGVASALNAGLRQAEGKWICWLSSDDLFDTRKLAIHREWITRYPDCRFFFTHFRYLEDKTGQLSDPPLWRTIPDPEWQILEMLPCTYVHGNSICVHKDAWAQAGEFDEQLRYGQDYDMWLRLLALYPATFIPERTCITRWHTLQESKTFPKAGFFDSAKAAINFLNKHSFSELVPLVDLSNIETARNALVKALDIAADPQGFLYALGPHPALLFRIMEWAWRDAATETAGPMQRIIQQRTREVSRRYAGTQFGFLWKAAAVASRLPQRRFDYQPISPAEVAEAHYWMLKSLGNVEAEPLSHYLEKFDSSALPKDLPALEGRSKEVVLVCQMGTHLDDPIKYGTYRATLELGKYLMCAGRMVLLTGLSRQGIGFIDGILFVGAADNKSWAQAIAGLGPIDTLVGISRGDILRRARARRYLVYHHGPHPIEGVSTREINKANIQVVCVSQYTRASQIGYGVRDDLVHVAYAAYDPLIFHMQGDEQRHPHSLIYVGHVVHYKGTDVALRSFAIIRSRFPDAVFRAYGRPVSWRGFTEHLFSPGWLDPDGFPLWATIEQELPGLKYCGEVSQTEMATAFRQHSLLIGPSRIAETFGIVSLEAQACGCIPVLPRRGGFPETMQEGKTGYMYDENTPEGLAAKILELWEHNLPIEAQREEAQKWVRATFSWEKSGAALLNIIESIPIRTSTRQVFFSLALRCERIGYTIVRMPRGLAVARRRIRGKPLAQWPGILRNLWVESQE